MIYRKYENSLFSNFRQAQLIIDINQMSPAHNRHIWRHLLAIGHRLDPDTSLYSSRQIYIRITRRFMGSRAGCKEKDVDEPSC